MGKFNEEIAYTYLREQVEAGERLKEYNAWLDNYETRNIFYKLRFRKEYEKVQARKKVELNNVDICTEKIKRLAEEK